MKWLRRRLGVWWHWQNLETESFRDEDGRQRERPRGRGWKNGRAWVHWPSRSRYGDSVLGVEWKVFRPLYPIGFHIRIEQDEHPISTGWYLWPFSLYLHVESRFARWIAARLTKPTYDGERATEVKVTWRDSGPGLAWRLWSTEDSWSSKTPRWRDGHLEFMTLLFGKSRYSKRVIETVDAMVPMPERTYPARVTRFESTWWRPRLPFWKRSVLRAEVNLFSGIPIPGKGENAWDCGDDATLSSTMPARTVEEAIGKVVEGAMRDRYRRSGRYTFEPSGMAAD